MLSLILGLALASTPAGDPPVAAKSFAELKRQYTAAEEAWDQKFSAPEMSDPNGIGAIARYAEWPAWEFAPRFLAIAEADPKGPEAFDSLVWIAGLNRQVGMRDVQIFRTYGKAMEMLERHYVDDRRLKGEEEVLRVALSPAWDHFIRKAADSKDRELRGLATLRLGMSLAVKAKIRCDPWYAKPDKTAFQTFLTGRLDPNFLRFIAECDYQETRLEAERMLLKVRDELGDVPHRNTTLKDMAERELAEMMNHPQAK